MAEVDLGEDARAIADVLRRFASHAETVLFGSGEGPDGDVGAVPGLIEEAARIGVVAEPGGEGLDTGVWGRHVWQQGLWLSLQSLSILAGTCAGLAYAVHAKGIASLAAARSAAGRLGGAGTNTAAAIAAPGGSIVDPRSSQDALTLLPGPRPGAQRLCGSAVAIAAVGAPTELACLARLTNAGSAPTGWAVVAVAAGAAGSSLSHEGRPLGLRAVDRWRISCRDVPVEEGDLLLEGAAAARTAAEVVACDWLGQAAIAAGVGKRAVGEARHYAASRRQGGSTIARLPAVKALLGRAAFDAEILDAVLAEHAHQPLEAHESGALLRWAARARVAAADHGLRAVTDSLQVFGGYGYLDDYGMSKRLRDIQTLITLHGSTQQLIPAGAADPSELAP